jgi:hypothetical protein
MKGIPHDGGGGVAGSTLPGPSRRGERVTLKDATAGTPGLCVADNSDTGYFDPAQKREAPEVSFSLPAETLSRLEQDRSDLRFITPFSVREHENPITTPPDSVNTNRTPPPITHLQLPPPDQPSISLLARRPFLTEPLPRRDAAFVLPSNPPAHRWGCPPASLQSSGSPCITVKHPLSAANRSLVT